MSSGTDIKRRGGIRPIVPAKRCPYCNRRLDRYCQAKRVYRWGRLQFELVRLVCRRAECRAQARDDGWME